MHISSIPHTAPVSYLKAKKISNPDLIIQTVEVI